MIMSMRHHINHFKEVGVKVHFHWHFSFIREFGLYKVEKVCRALECMNSIVLLLTSDTMWTAI